MFCKPMSQDNVEFDEILEKGDEKMEKYINAEFIFEALQEHQRILRKLMPEEVKEKLYDDVITINGDKFAEPVEITNVTVP